MKILHVYKTYHPDDFTGVPRVIHALSESLIDRGVESHVLALSEMPSSTPLRVDHHHVHQARRDLHIASTGLSFSAFAKFRSLVRTVDIVHYHYPWPMGDLLHLVHGSGVPSVVTYHSDIVKQKRLLRFYTPLMHRFLSSANAIVATSPGYLETSPVLARYRSKTTVVPIGIAERPPLPNEELERLRDHVGEGFFLFIGALRYYKGIDFLIEAARETGLPVIIAGKNGADGPDIAKLPENITYVGEVTEREKEALLSLCSVFVFPSHLRSEAFGVSLVEAARAGKPMISCEIGTGTSYVNADQETGMVIPPADVPALSAAMRALADAPEERTRMGQNARARFERLFRAETMAAAYLRVYEKLLRPPVQ